SWVITPRGRMWFGDFRFESEVIDPIGASSRGVWRPGSAVESSRRIRPLRAVPGWSALGDAATRYKQSWSDLAYPLATRGVQGYTPLSAMPRGHKSKLRAREKRRQTRGEAQDPPAVQGTEAEVEESPSTSSSVSGGTLQGSGPPQKPQSIQSSTKAGVSHTRANKSGKSQDEEKPSTSKASASLWHSYNDPLSTKAGMLVRLLLYKYKMQEIVTKADMMKIVNKRYKEHFPEIFRRATERIELVFGLDLKAVKPSGHSYTVVSKLDLPSDVGLRGGWENPTNGLLMPLLGVIFLNGNRASESEIWQFLNILGVYDGKTHFIFGEPRKLITQDLVKERYLEYQRVPGSDPPRYEFLWGPRAHAETSKMKVLEFLAKVNDTIPSAFPPHYEEALRDEKERCEARAAAKAAEVAKAVAAAKARPSPAAPPTSRELRQSLPLSSAALPTFVMPRGQKSKLCACKERHQVRNGQQGQRSAGATAVEGSVFPSSPAPVLTKRKPGAKPTGGLKGPESAFSIITSSDGVSHTRSQKGINCGNGKKQNTSRFPPSTVQSQDDPFTRVAGMLVQFLIHRYKMRKPITRANMLKIIHKKYKKHFIEILRRASFNMEVVFGVDLKEVDSSKHSYVLVSKMNLPNNGVVSHSRGFPKTGLLMNLLGLIFMKGNCATEEMIWEFLNKMEIYAGKRHFIYGEPKKLITQDFVKLKYLEYHQVPNTNPARYEFLWGPRAHAETSKMKILEFWAKINHTVPTTFQYWYEEALKEEKKRVRVTVAPGANSDIQHQRASTCLPQLSVLGDHKQKSKLRAREKRHQARGETQSLRGAQAAAAEQEGSASSPSSPPTEPEATPPSSPTAGPPLEPEEAQASSCPEAEVSCPRSEEDAKSPEEASASTSWAAAPTQSTRKDPLTRKVGMLIQFLLEKYKAKEPILKANMLKVVNKKYKDHFHEILRRAAENLELVFGLELKEVKPGGHAYTLVSKLDLTDDGSFRGSWGLPKNGLLMPLLGVIFLNGNRASEEDIWDFLNILGVHDGQRHLIFGEPRKLITQDLVKERYLEYRQVPGSDPPRYEFLWGPRAHAETSKMKILEFLAKVNGTVPSAFPPHYEEALRDEEERSEARAAASQPPKPGRRPGSGEAPGLTPSASSTSRGGLSR
ncbi:Melanoma-associated antigen B3, partial [Galemys pyrenaicus]